MRTAGTNVWQVSGTYVHSFLHSPTTALPNVSIADTGKLVRTVVEDGQQYYTKTIAFYAQSLSEAEKLKMLGEGIIRFIAFTTSPLMNHSFERPNRIQSNQRSRVPTETC